MPSRSSKRKSKKAARRRKFRGPIRLTHRSLRSSRDSARSTTTGARKTKRRRIKAAKRTSPKARRRTKRRQMRKHNPSSCQTFSTTGLTRTDRTESLLPQQERARGHLIGASGKGRRAARVRGLEATLRVTADLIVTRRPSGATESTGTDNM